MYKTGKKEMVDTAELRVAIIKHMEKMGKVDFIEVDKADDYGVPIGAVIALANFTYSKDEKAKLKSNIFSKGLGWDKDDVECSIQAEIVPYSVFKGVSDNPSVINTIQLSLLRNYFKLGNNISETTLNSISALAKRISVKLTGIDFEPFESIPYTWDITLHCNKNIHDIADERFFDIVLRTLQALDETIKGEEGYITREDVRILYEVVEHPIALNLVKILSKHTDDEKHVFTGKCDGIALEALIASEYSLIDDFVLLKNFISAPNYYSVSNGFKPRDNKLIKVVKGIEAITCTRAVFGEYFGIEHMDTFKLACEAESHKYVSLIKRDSDTIDSDNESIDEFSFNTDGDKIEYRGAIINLGNTFGSIRYLNSKFMTMMQKVYIPYGMNLSESFKAKYI